MRYTHKRIDAYMTKRVSSSADTIRLTITISRQANLVLRSFLGAQGMKKGDLSKFIEEAVRWHIFQQTVGETRQAFADVPTDELHQEINEAVEEVRMRRYRDSVTRS